jgi:hypothetical protein
MIGLRGYAVVAATIVSAFLGGGIAQGAPSAVALHEPELPGAATVWCLSNPKDFADAARAVGLDIGTAQDGAAFDRPGGRTIDLQEWATSPDPDDIQDFDAACLPAYEAFGTSAAPKSDSDDQTLDTVLSVLLGAALATGSSVGVERWRLNRREADDLRHIGLELREAVGEYISKPSEAPAIEQAKATALKLKAVLGDFDSVAPRSVDKARAAIDKLLTGQPRIGDLGTDTEGVELMGSVSTIRGEVKTIANRAAHPRRSQIFRQ